MALAAVTYLDRVCISVVAPSIMRDLNLSTIQMSYVFSAFTLAYAAFEIPTAWWADRIGSRAVLTRIVLVVVRVHACYRCCIQLRQYVDRPVSIRCRRSRGLAECSSRLLALDSGSRARPCTGNILCGRSLIRRTDADPRCVDGDLPALAHDIHCLRVCGRWSGQQSWYLVVSRCRPGTMRPSARLNGT